MEDSTEKPLKELFAEAIAKRKAREEAERKAIEESVTRWVPTALAATLATARRSAEHGGGSSRVVEPAFSIPSEYRRRVWAQMLDQLAEIGAKEGFEIVPHGDRHYLVWDHEAWDRKPPPEALTP